MRYRIMTTEALLLSLTGVPLRVISVPGGMEHAALYLSRFATGLLERMIRNRGL